MPDAPGTVNVGGMHVKKQTAMIVGIGGVGVLGVVWYRSKQSSNAANAAAATSQAGANTGIDPATGYAYGSPEDAAALANQGQYVSPYGSGNSAGYYNGYPYTPPGTAQPGSFTNNAQWAQYVEQYITSQDSAADPNAIGNAIGKYINGSPLTTQNMIDIVQQAIAIGGYPPIAGTNGNPPHYITAIPVSHSGLITIPNLAGQSAGSAHNTLAGLGLIPSAPKSQKANMKVWFTNPRAGSRVTQGTRVTINTKGFV